MSQQLETCLLRLLSIAHWTGQNGWIGLLVEVPSYQVTPWSALAVLLVLEIVTARVLTSQREVLAVKDSSFPSGQLQPNLHTK